MFTKKKVLRFFIITMILAVLSMHLLWKLSLTKLSARNRKNLTQTRSHDSQWINKTKNCVKKKTVVFLKTHKTGGSTIWWIMQNFALLNKLQVFIPKRTKPIGDHFMNNNTVKVLVPPKGVRVGDYRKYKYNMFSIHTRYNRTILDSLMKKNPMYVTIIRNPITQFESAFDYFGVAGHGGNKTRKLTEWMRNPFENCKRSKQPFVCHNQQMFDLGVDPLLDVNTFLVDKSIKNLDKDFDLVMITELFDESLIILKKVMCWKFDDIVYLPKKKRTFKVPLSEDLVQKIGNWNLLDMKLYNYFKKRFHDHIKEYGPNFESDLAVFRKLKLFLYNVCVVKEKVVKMNGVPVTSYERRLHFDANFSTDVGTCKRDGSLQECDFGNGQIMSFNFKTMCKNLQTIPTKFVPRIKNMMMKGRNDSRLFI